MKPTVLPISLEDFHVIFAAEKSTPIGISTSVEVVPPGSVQVIGVLLAVVSSSLPVIRRVTVIIPSTYLIVYSLKQYLFANSVASPAIEFKSEGQITGVGAKMFAVAGPVIVFGTLFSVIYGVIYYVIGVL